MSKRIFQLLLVAFLFTGTLWAAADDPFVGKWKLNPSKSILTDVMKVTSDGGNKYTFDFGGGSETIVVDGTDQPGNFGSTLAVTIAGPDTWKVVRKTNGRMEILGIWKLSADGSTLHDDFTGYRPNGSTSHLDYMYKRTAGSSGFAGTWESVSEKVDSVFEVEIRPYEVDGLSFINPGQTDSLKFDGKDYPSVGANVPPGLVNSGRRVDERAVEMTVKIKDKVLDTQGIKVSADGKTLTITVRPVDRSQPNVLVFDRE